MAQEGPDLGQRYWAEKALQAAPGAGQVAGQSHSFFYRSNTLNQGTSRLPAVGGGEGQ